MRLLQSKLAIKVTLLYLLLSLLLFVTFKPTQLSIQLRPYIGLFPVLPIQIIILFITNGTFKYNLTTKSSGMDSYNLNVESYYTWLIIHAIALYIFALLIEKVIRIVIKNKSK